MDETIKLTPTQRLVIDAEEIKKTLEGVSTKVDKHHKILVEGNGEIPLVEKVRNIQSFVDSQKFWLKTILVAIVLQTITFSAAALVYFIRLYPLLESLQKASPK